jgi:hypothetical protein
MVLRFSILLFALAAGSEARAEQWWFADGNRKSVLYVDRDSLRTDGEGRRHMRTSFHYRKAYRGSHYARTESQYDCEKRTMALVTFAAHGANGEVLAYTDFPVDPPFERPKAGSLGEAEIKFACDGPADGAHPIEGTPSEAAAEYFARSHR